MTVTPFRVALSTLLPGDTCLLDGRDGDIYIVQTEPAPDVNNVMLLKLNDGTNGEIFGGTVVTKVPAVASLS